MDTQTPQTPQPDLLSNTKGKRQPRFRRVAFTSFLVEEPLWNADKMSVLIYQLEECPDTSRPHWQGYCEFKGQHELSRVQSLLGIGKSHIETAKGSPYSNYCYCNSKGTYKDKPNLGRQVCIGYEPGVSLSASFVRRMACLEMALDTLMLCNTCDNYITDQHTWDETIKHWCWECRTKGRHHPDV